MRQLRLFVSKKQKSVNQYGGHGTAVKRIHNSLFSNPLLKNVCNSAFPFRLEARLHRYGNVIFCLAGVGNDLSLHCRSVHGQAVASGLPHGNAVDCAPEFPGHGIVPKTGGQAGVDAQAAQGGLDAQDVLADVYECPGGGAGQPAVAGGSLLEGCRAATVWA